MELKIKMVFLLDSVKIKLMLLPEHQQEGLSLLCRTAFSWYLEEFVIFETFLTFSLETEQRT